MTAKGNPRPVARRSQPQWDRELASLHATTPPRSGEPLRRLVRAQLGRWWLQRAFGFAAVIAIGGGAFALFSDDEFTRGAGAVALGVLPVLGVGHLVEYLKVGLLAREGQMAIARVEPLGGKRYMLHFCDGDRRARWSPGLELDLNLETTATVLYHPHRRVAFAWAAKTSGAARQAPGKPARATARVRR